MSERLEKLGRYEIQGVLGKGAMGVVFKGYDPKIGRTVALKTIRTDSKSFSPEEKEIVQRFHREASAAGKLAHPNIVTIYDIDESDGVSFIAMEFVEGIGLEKAVKERGRLSVQGSVEVIIQMCEALQYLHDNGIIHRDIKPSNIMLLEGSQKAKLMDFGIAKDLDYEITQPGAVLGTPHYMSPEQFSGHPVEPRSDLFSLGIVLYELLTGEKPFAGESITSLMHKILNTEPIEPRTLNIQVSREVNAASLKALAKDPTERYQTGTEMAEGLRQAIAGTAAAPSPDLDSTMAAAGGTTMSSDAATAPSAHGMPAQPAAQPAARPGPQPPAPPQAPPQAPVAQPGQAMPTPYPGSHPGQFPGTVPNTGMHGIPQGTPVHPGMAPMGQTTPPMMGTGMPQGYPPGSDQYGVPGMGATQVTGSSGNRWLLGAVVLLALALVGTLGFFALQNRGGSPPGGGPGTTPPISTSAKAQVEVDPSWIGGVLVLDRTQIPIQRNRIHVEPGYYSEVSLRKPGYEAVEFSDVEITTSEPLDMTYAQLVPVN